MKQLFSISLFLFFIVSCAVQQVGERIAKTSLIIYNNSNNKKSFLLGETTLKMDTFKIKANEVWSSPVYNRHPIIKLQTQNHAVTYQLIIGKKYMVFWNVAKKSWDVKKMKKRQ